MSEKPERTVVTHRLRPDPEDAYGYLADGSPAPREFVIERSEQDQEGRVTPDAPRPPGMYLTEPGEVRWRNKGPRRVTDVARLTRRELQVIVTDAVTLLAYLPEDEAGDDGQHA